MSSSASNSELLMRYLDKQVRKEGQSPIELLAQCLNEQANFKPARPRAPRTNTKHKTFEIDSLEKLEEIEESSGQSLCHYKAVRGEVVGKYCGAIAKNTDEVTDRSLYRCGPCSKKTGGKKGKSGKKNIEVRSPDVLQTEKTIRAPIHNTQKVEYTSHKCVPSKYKIAKNTKIAGFVFDGRTCVGKIDLDDDGVDDMIGDIEGSLQKLSSVDVETLHNNYNCPYREFGAPESEDDVPPRPTRPLIPRKVVSKADDADGSDDEPPRPSRSVGKKSVPASRPPPSDDDDDDEPPRPSRLPVKKSVEKNGDEEAPAKPSVDEDGDSDEEEESEDDAPPPPKSRTVSALNKFKKNQT